MAGIGFDINLGDEERDGDFPVFRIATVRRVYGSHCPNCESELHSTQEWNITRAREQFLMDSERMEEEYRNRSIPPKLRSIYIDGAKYDHLQWMSEEDFEREVKPSRSSLDYPYCLSDEEITSLAVSWCTNGPITKRKTRWSFFYPNDERHWHMTSYSRVLQQDENSFEVSERGLNDEDNAREIFEQYPPDVLVGKPPIPMSIDYEKKVRRFNESCNIRSILYSGEIYNAVKKANEYDITEEKRKLPNLIEELVLFARGKKSRSVSNKLLDEFINENEIELIWRDSRDILRIGAGFIMVGKRNG